MCASLAPEGLDGFYSWSVFKKSCTTGLCSVNVKAIAPKILTLSNRLQKQNGVVLQNVSIDFDYISIIYGKYLPK
jgi:hypothetical protein